MPYARLQKNDAQNLPPSLVCATFSQTFVVFVLFSRDWVFFSSLLLWELVHDKIQNLFSQTEAWW